MKTALALACAVFPVFAAAAPEKVIFDTDTAYFHDDGAALAMLLRSPEKIEVVGVTVTAGNEHAVQGAEYMLHLMELLGAAKVPLLIGAKAPLANSRERVAQMAKEWKIGFKGALGGDAPAADGLAPPFGGKFAATRPREGHAVDFIIETVERNPGQVTLLAVGPMTNVAGALAKKPSIAKKIKRLVFMGGSVRAPGNITTTAEFNFWFDPEAARAVLRSGIREKVMFGLDVTNLAPLVKKDFDEIVAFKTPLTALYEDGLGNQWPGFYKKPEKVSYYWDCLPVAWLLDPAVITAWETLRLDVDADHRTVGYGKVLTASRAPAQPVKVAFGLDRSRFWASYKDLLTRPLD